MIRRAVAVLILGVLCARVLWTIETEWATGGPSTQVIIAPGTSTRAVAEALASAGVIPRPWSFAVLARLRGDGARLKAGRYRFEGPYSLLDVEKKLAEGDVERREITIPEGLSMFEISLIVEKGGLKPDQFLAAARDPVGIADLDPAAKTLEGYLFPETYDILDGATEAALATEMVKRAKTVFADIGLAAPGRSIGGVKFTLREIVTLASIVELESAVPEERRRIAGVFLSRLRKGMKLQTDPTVIYALKLDGRYDGNIRKADLSNASPYNTYRFDGLPPGPIGSPGLAALKAVLEPETTDALYFVSRNDGTHVFSKTLKDHERAVDEYQRHRATRAAVKPPDPAPPPPK